MTVYLAIALFSLFIFFLPIIFIIGLIEPKRILRRSKNPTRIKVLGWWFLSEFLCLGAFIACFIIDINKVGLPKPKIDETTGKWGYVEYKKKVIPFIYDEANNFSYFYGDCSAKVKLNGKYGYINKKGEVLMPLIFDEIEKCTWISNMIKVMLDGKYGLYNTSWKEIVPPVYDYIESFTEDLTVVISNGKKGLIDRNAKELVPPVYDYIERFSGDVAVVISNGKKGLIDRNGKELVPPFYDEIGKFTNDMAEVKAGGKKGIINRTGKEIVPPVYDEIYNFVDDVAGVVVDGKKGFIDRNGKEVISPIYEITGYYFSGIEKVCLKGKYGFIDRKGQVVIPIIYDHIGEFSDNITPAGEINNNLAPVKSKGKFGYINKEGDVIIPLKYDEAENFANGYANVRLAQSKGRINLHGVFTGESVKISLLEAVKKKYVRFSANGISIQSSKINLENITDMNLNLTIPAGTFLSANSSGYQNMVLTKPTDIVLNARQRYSQNVSTACMNIHRSIPGDNNTFGLAQRDNNHLLTKVIKLFNDGNYSYAVKQAAVWIVTDGATYSSMGILQNQSRQRIISNDDYKQAVSIVNQAKKMK